MRALPGGGLVGSSSLNCESACVVAQARPEMNMSCLCASPHFGRALCEALSQEISVLYRSQAQLVALSRCLYPLCRPDASAGKGLGPKH